MKHRHRGDEVSPSIHRLQHLKLTATSATDTGIEWDPDTTVDDGRLYCQGKDTDFSTIGAEALVFANGSG